MTLGLICPSIFEYNALNLKALRKTGAVVVKSGMGKLRAQYACSDLLRKHPRLKHLLLIGFAGGLTPNLKVGDVIEPKLFVEQDYYAEPFEKFPNLISRKGKKLFRESHEPVMLTQDRFLTENPHKTGPYAKRFGKVACDMESYAVAHFGTRSKIPFSVVKLVSDSADENADHDFLKACKRLSPKLNVTVLAAAERIRS